MLSQSPQPSASCARRADYSARTAGFFNSAPDASSFRVNSCSSASFSQGSAISRKATQCSDLAVKLGALAASLSIFAVVGHVGMELEVLKTKRALARAEWPKSASIADLLRFGGRQYAIKRNAFSRARQPTEVDPVCHRFTANPLEREE